MNKSLLDTDIFSEVSKGIDPNVARDAAAYRSAFGRYTLSVITVMEVVRGFQQKQNAQRLHHFLSAIASEEILPFDQAAAEMAGRIAGDLDRTGQPIGRADPMIAAIALMLFFPQGQESIKQRPIVHCRDAEVTEESSIVDILAFVRLQFVPIRSRPGECHAETE